MTTIKDQIQKLLQQRDDAYEAFSQKTEDIFYNKYVVGHNEWSAIWETRREFHLADVCVGMGVGEYIEIALAQGRDPEWLAFTLCTLAIDADKRGAA